jgi:curved DNA-binding protein CbpA
MTASTFVDYYEILEISPNANTATLERMFRYLAQRYHPDNQDTGDRARFDAIMEAYDTLREPGQRAQYDVKHKNNSGLRWKLVEEAGDNTSVERDIENQNKLLSILYIRRRHNISDPGLGNHTLERLLSCPAEHLEFHIWYLKEKGWIRATDNGMFTITVEGVDRVNSEQHRKIVNKLLTDQRQASKTEGDEKRSFGSRRSGTERRSGRDTRSEEEKAVVGERRRSNSDRRSPSDRRSERRAE